MKNWRDVINSIKKSIVLIRVTTKDNLAEPADGTGVIINDKGCIITARHNVENYLEDDKNRCKIIVVNKNIPDDNILKCDCREYRIMNNSTMLSHDNAIDMYVDLVLLEPVVSFKSEHYVELDLSDNITEGNEVIMCGFSRESSINQVLKVDEIVDYAYAKEKEEVRNGIKELYSIQFKSIFYKSGIIANATRLMSKVVNLNKDVTFTYFYVDNVCHEGMSGGPIFNMHGGLIGIIIHKTTVQTDIEIEKTDSQKSQLARFNVHSGCTLGLSIHAINMCHNVIIEQSNKNICVK